MVGFPKPDQELIDMPDTPRRKQADEGENHHGIEDKENHKFLSICGSSTASCLCGRTSSEALLVAFLNSLMPVPKPLASSGSFLAPKRISTRARIKMISVPPRLNRASTGFSFIF